MTLGIPPGLRVKPAESIDSVWEMTFAPDGRATFQYGEEICPGQLDCWAERKLRLV
jgi:hypothetical protein